MRVVLIVGVLAACACTGAPKRVGSSKPFAEGAVAVGTNPGFSPTTDAYNPNFDGPPPGTGPVFVIPWKASGALTEQEQEAERQRYVAIYRTYWMSDPTVYQEHHLFPRALRDDFKRYGIDVDLYTILVHPEKHRQAHSGQEMYGPGGLWNWEWNQWVLNAGEKARDKHFAAWKRAFEMIEKYGLAPHGPLCPYRCGREVVHDPFDVSTIPKAPSKK
jgi:hypothetical protein